VLLPKRIVEIAVAAVTLAALLLPFLVLALLVLIETGGVLVRRGDGNRTTTLRFRTRRARSVARPGTTFSVDIAGRIGPVGRLLRRTRLVALPELVWTLARRIRFAGGVPPHPKPVGPTRVLPAPPRADEAKVDAGQLAR